MVDLMESPLLQKWLGEAEQKGQRQMLLRLLTRKFGILPPALIDHVSSIADIERLEKLADAAIDATSLNDFTASLE